MVVASDIGSVLIGILIVLALVSFVVRKFAALNSTLCAHCGHDNGLPGCQARVCPACGRNKTILNSHSAARR